MRILERTRVMPGRLYATLQDIDPWRALAITTTLIASTNLYGWVNEAVDSREQSQRIDHNQQFVICALIRYAQSESNDSQDRSDNDPSEAAAADDIVRLRSRLKQPCPLT